MHYIGDDDDVVGACDHILRIFKQKHALFNKSSTKRNIAPHTLAVGAEGTLSDLVQWLISYVGTPNTLARRKCCEFITRLTPLLQGKYTFTTLIHPTETQK